MRGHHSSRIATLCSGVLLAVCSRGASTSTTSRCAARFDPLSMDRSWPTCRGNTAEMGLRREFGRDQGNPRENEAGRQLPIPHHGTGYWV